MLTSTFATCQMRIAVGAERLRKRCLLERRFVCVHGCSCVLQCYGLDLATVIHSPPLSIRFQ